MNLKLMFIFCLIHMLIGCSSSSNDIKKKMEQIKKSTITTIEELPEIKDYTPIPYPLNKYNDPFTPVMNQNVTAKNSPSTPMLQNKRPDLDRSREYLESFPLDTLHMVGILERKNEVWALIIDRSGILHKVKQGNYLGQNSGKIINIDEEGMEIEEIITDGQGGWTNRNASIKIKSN